MKAHAVYDHMLKKIELNTVFETERGAMVNGLVTIYNIPVTREWSEDRIRQEWRAWNPEDNVRFSIREVTVELSS